MKKPKLKIETVSDTEALGLWKNKEEVTLEECLKESKDVINNVRSQLTPKIGLWLKLNVPTMNTGIFIEDELNEDQYVELMSLNSQLSVLYNQLSQLTSFRYSLRFPELDYKYFKSKVKEGVNTYWVIESKRYKKLDKKFKKDNNGKSQLYI